MVNIPDIGDKIPLMFRAQTKGRSQLQYIDSKKDENDSQKWVKEWIERVDENPPQFVREDTRVVDLGCSTGKLLERIPFAGEKVGIDVSTNLLPESHDNILYVRKDIRSLNTFGNCGLVLSLSTLQFIPYEDRPAVS